MQDIRNTLIFIVKTAKKIVETISVDFDQKKSFNELFKKEDFIINEKGKGYRKYCIDIFDNVSEYYKDLISYFDFYTSNFFAKEQKDLIKFNSAFSTIYFSLLTDLLLNILENNKEAYLDDIIKFDITIICEIFAEKYEKMIYSDTFFMICYNELKEKYYKNASFEKNDFVKKMDVYYKDEALKKLNKIKSQLHSYIHRGLYTYYSYIYSQDTKNMNSTELNEHSEKCRAIKLAYEELKNSPKYKNDLNELKFLCLQDKNKKYFEELSRYLSLKIFNSQDESENVLNNFVLPLNILEIELDDNNAKIIYNLKYNETVEPGHYFLYGETFYQKFLTKTKELGYAKLNNYKSEIINLINDNNFLKDFYSILKSQSISYYFLNTNTTQCLKEQYMKFMQDIKKSNYNLLKNIIRVKDLCYKIPALTGSSMKIFINPILDFSNQAKMDNVQRQNILKSALIIILLHEIAQLLKFYPVKDAYPSITPFTFKGRKNKKGLIYHLFGIEEINNINNDQSQIINKVETWENSNNLKDIFQDEEKLSINSKIGELNLYLSSFNFNGDDEGEEKKNNYEYCSW